MPEPVRVDVHAALPAAAGGYRVDTGGGQRLPVACAQPQLRPPGLRVPGPGAEIPVQAPGSLVADPDDPVLAALAADGDLPLPQVDVAAPRGTGVVPQPGQFGHPDPLTTAMIAVSRRWAKLRPAQACSSRASSSPVKTGTSFSVTRGGCAPPSGGGPR